MNAAETTSFVDTVRDQFPILKRTVHGGKPLVYLDNAATTQKPQSVIDAIVNFYTSSNSNVHRGAHAVSAEATALYEGARERVQRFINAESTSEIVFTRGTTESINLVAFSWGRLNVVSGDEILVTEMEHHANIVPWQMLCAAVGATLKVVPVQDDGSIDLEMVLNMLTGKTKLIALTHASNTLGTINRVKQICELARQQNITSLIDGAQMVLHHEVDVQDLGCDFYTFSSHKLYGPTGIGVLYGRAEVLAAMPPYQGGGAMIDRVSFNGTTYGDAPVRFEAGTPHIAGAVGMSAAIEWFTKLDADALHAHENTLTQTATKGLLGIDGLRIIGTTSTKIGVISFVVKGCHGADIGTLCDEQGVAVRTGHHCTMPLMERFGLTSTVRASFGAYNTVDEVNMLVDAVQRSVRMLR